MPKILAGLGNPTSEYEHTRHNVGFDCLDSLAQHLNVSFSESAKFFSLLAKQENCYFLKPQTYMNHSGKAVGALAHFYKIKAKDILIVHDDLDLMPGQIRLKQGGGNGGHNGLKSIEASLGNKNFWRIRVGIGHPRSLNLNQNVADFVLSRAAQDDFLKIQHAIAHIVRHFHLIQQNDFAAAQRIWHALK